MIGHRTYLDAPYSAATRTIRQPVARGHRKWLSVAKPTIAQVDTLPKGQDGEAGLVRSKGSAVPKGCAQPIPSSHKPT